MAITKEFRDLAKHAARRTAPANFDINTVEEAFKTELQKYCGSIAQFMKNRYDLYEIITENADDIVPKNVEAAIGIFAEVKQVPQGAKVTIKTSKLASKMRARKFLTQAGLAGVYEAFRLDSESYDIKTNAVGGAIMIDFERMRDGHESISEVMEVMTDALTESVFSELQRAMKAMVNSVDVPAANKVIDNVFNGAEMFRLCSIAKAYSGYGSSPSTAVIVAPPEFIADMGPDAIVPVSVGTSQGIYHPDDIDRIHRTGYINLFRGTPVVQMPQSYTDTTNTTTYVDPQIAYIMPTGKEKLAKIVLEGNTQMYDWVNKDASMELHLYKKIGVVIENHPGVCIYQNTGIPQTVRSL